MRDFGNGAVVLNAAANCWSNADPTRRGHPQAHATDKCDNHWAMKVSTKFVKSAAAPTHFPPEAYPEIAFVGRSNVGKSSLLNSLVGDKQAHVSSTPGRTQTINFFHVNFGPLEERPDVLFADLPGYGYARAPKAIVSEWPKFIEPYLIERGSLALCVSLVDAYVPPQKSDVALVEWLRGQGRNFVVVATKSDRLSGNGLAKSLKALQAALGAEPLVFSAKTGRGRDELWRQIRGAADGWHELNR